MLENTALAFHLTFTFMELFSHNSFVEINMVKNVESRSIYLNISYMYFHIKIFSKNTRFLQIKIIAQHF